MQSTGARRVKAFLVGVAYWVVIAAVGIPLAAFVALHAGLWTLDFLVTYFPWY